CAVSGPEDRHIDEREAEFSAGPPQGKSAPSGGSDVHAVTSVGADFSAGPPQGKTAPPGGSDVHAVTSVGAEFSAGPPQGKSAPPGGSDVHAVTSVGAISLRRYLLLGILLPICLLIVINTVSLYRQTLAGINIAYDRTLLASAKTIGEQLDV